MGEALYKGNSHATGGIKVNVDGIKTIEVEGHEYLLCNTAMQSTKIFEFKNKTNKQILDEFHAYSTCEFKQNEAHSGDFIICKKVVLDTNKRNITGTIKEIVNIMQSEKGCRQSTDNVFKTGGEVENEGSKNLMKWYIDWYKNISDKMNITLSLPNLLAPFKEKNVVIMDLFEKIDQNIDAKIYLQKIINKADEYKVTIYLEPMPRYKYFLKNIEKRKKISKEYLIEYYEKFGFKLTPNAQFMKRKFNGNEINIFDETKYDDNGKVCYWKTYTFNDSSISIDYCLDNFFKIDAIGTKEKSRRGGDASKLIAYVKEIAVKNNFQKIDVYLPIDENTPRKEYSLEDYKKAVSFYKKNGFKFYENSTVKMFCEVKADKLKTGGYVNLKKLVEPVNELAIEINKLYNEWNKIKNDKDWKKWQENVKSKRYGTYQEKDILDILDNFNPKYPNDIIKKGWMTELYKALGQDIPTHLKGKLKASDSEINELKARISEKTYKYALLLRPFDIGTYPKQNFIKFIDDVKYPHGLIEYLQPIPLEQIKHYSLSPITEINEFDGKEFTYYEDLKAKAQIVKNNSNIPYVKVTMFDENNEVSDEATIDAVNFMENVSSGRYKIINEKETLQGGVGDKKTIEAIAKKHNVSLDYAKEQLAKGIKVESEHTNDIQKQTEIAIDHLFEFIEYYNELEKMETNLKAKETQMENKENIEFGSPLKKAAYYMTNKIPVDYNETPAYVVGQNLVKNLNDWYPVNKKFDNELADNFGDLLGAVVALSFTKNGMPDVYLSATDFSKLEDYNKSRLSKEVEHEIVAKKNIMENNNIEINSEIVNNYDQVPVVWKNTSEIKEINFINSPFNKDLIKILTPFAGTDELRPIFSGIHCDKNGITVTDAHKLITLPYPNKDFKGTYATFPNTKIISASGAEVKNDIFTNIDYPNYAVVIPKAEDAERVQKISVYKLLQYTEVALHYSNKATNQVIYNLGNLGIGANGKFLIDILETALKLGYKELYAYTTTKSRPIVFSPSKNYALGKDVILLCMPTYIVEEFVDEGVKVYYYGAADLDWGREITAYYDFSKDEIVNKDGSIADFKMNYGEYDVLSSNEIKMLKNFAKNTSLPILEYFRVKDNEISASDLETYLTIKETNLKDGLYKINDNAAEYDSSMTLGNFDMFPNPNEDKSENQIKFIINSEVLLHYINIAIDYTGKDELRPVMTGILFDYKDDKMFMVATDAHKLFKLEITQYVEINKGQKDFQFILSKANLLKFLENTDESSVIVSATINNVTFENDLFKFKSRLIDGRYPNYNAVIPTYKTKKLIINIKDLFSCLKSKEAENFIKANKKEEIRIYNKIGKSNDIFDIFLCYTEYDRAKEIHNIVSEIKICQVNYKLEDGNFQIQNNLVLLMPVNLALADNFTFDLKYFKVILESLNCENVEMLYDEKNRAYIFGGDCFAYKHTIKAQKSISKPKETPAKVETKKVEPKESTESNEIEKAIETFEMLVNLGGTKKELKEWSEAIETFKMLVGDDKKPIKSKNLLSVNEIREQVNSFLNPLGYTAIVDDLGQGDINIQPSTKKVGKNRTDFFDGMQINRFKDGTYEVSEYQAGKDNNELYIYKETNSLTDALKDLIKGNKRKPIKKYKNGGDINNSFYALTSDGMRNKKRVKILKVQYWKGRETNHAPTLESIKEFLSQVPKDEKIVIYADEDYIDDSTIFYGQLHSAYTPLYTAGAVTVDAIIDENNDIIWNRYEKSNYNINVDDYKFKDGGNVKNNESDWFWNHAYRHYMRDASLEQRNEVKEQFIKEDLELDGESPRHFEIISNIIGEYADGGDINDLTY
jgi:hypothetical protein